MESKGEDTPEQKPKRGSADASSPPDTCPGGSWFIVHDRQNNELKRCTCIRHAPHTHSISLVGAAGSQKAAASSRWQAAFCNFLPPSGGRIKPTPPTSVEKESARDDPCFISGRRAGRISSGILFPAALTFRPIIGTKGCDTFRNLERIRRERASFDRTIR